MAGEKTPPFKVETANLSPADLLGSFSFIYGGTASGELLGGWQTRRDVEKLDENRARHTITYTDPKAGLEVRCQAVEYADFPAVEWLLYFHNGGEQDTPIIERIEPLDLQIAGDPEGFTLHYSLGDTNSADSFAPMDHPLKSGGPYRGSEWGPFVLAPHAGRSSSSSHDGYWWSGALPFFNLEWQGAGAVIAVGWSGQWEASFQHIGGNVLSVQAGQ